jgi:predicted RNase H-related nuclease YkuK (DUF458 family)
MDVTKRFKKFGGEFIPDIIEYLKECIEKDPSITISLGCDSIQRRRKTIYAITLMLYNQDIKNGAHVVFFRENVTKIRDNFERLHKEAQYVQEIGDFLNSKLESFYTRKDLNELERRKYKYHVAKCNGEYAHVIDDETVMKNMPLTEHEKTMNYKLIDLHLDFNPVEGKVDGRGFAKNRSNLSYKTYVPWLRGMGYRVWSKPASFAASSAADLLLQD